MGFRLPPLYPILDARLFPPAQPQRAAWLAHMVAELADAGVTLLQLRAKHDDREQFLRDAAAMRSAAPAGMTLLLNDRVELVREAGFHGAHLGQGDMPIEAARSLLGPDAVLGLSTHTIAQVQGAESRGADYLATGPVFATASKHDTEPVIGLAGVAAAREATGKPLAAIGGITRERAPGVWEAGADSVAVIGALFAADLSPGAIARDFLRLFRYNSM